MSILGVALRSAFRKYSEQSALSIPRYTYSMTYSGLLEKADAWSKIFEQYQEYIFVIHLEKIPELYEIVLQLLFEGRAYCALDFSFPVNRVLEVARQFQSALIVTSTPENFANNATLLHVIDTKEGLSLLILNRSLDSRAHTAHAYHIATSGSTGVPKIVVIHQDNILPYCQWLSESEFVNQSARWAQFSGPGFDLFLEDMVTTFLGGGELFILSGPAERGNAGMFIERHCITHWNSVPSVIPSIIRNNANLSSVRVFHFVGEPLPRAHLQQLKLQAPSARFVNKYCPTESALYCCQHLVTQDDLDEFAPATLPVGISAPGAHFAFLEEGDYFRAVIISNNIATGYHLGSANTFGTMMIDGREITYFDTGDYFSSRRGQFYFSHRTDGMIKVRGNRIDKGDVVHAAIESGMTDAVVVHFDSKLILVHERSTHVISERDLFTALRARLPSFALPNKIVAVDEFPRTHSGKIDHVSLKSIVESRLGTTNE